MSGRIWVSHSRSGKINQQRSPPGKETCALDTQAQVDTILPAHSLCIYKFKFAAVLGRGYTTAMMQRSRQPTTRNSEAQTNRNI